MTPPPRPPPLRPERRGRGLPAGQGRPARAGRRRRVARGVPPDDRPAAAAALLPAGLPRGGGRSGRRSGGGGGPGSAGGRARSSRRGIRRRRRGRRRRGCRQRCRQGWRGCCCGRWGRWRRWGGPAAGRDAPAAYATGGERVAGWARSGQGRRGLCLPLPVSRECRARWGRAGGGVEDTSPTSTGAGGCVAARQRHGAFNGYVWGGGHGVRAGRPSGSLGLDASSRAPRRHSP